MQGQQLFQNLQKKKKKKRMIVAILSELGISSFESYGVWAF